jgi:hypothetical protein
LYEETHIKKDRYGKKVKNLIDSRVEEFIVSFF